MNHGGQTVYEMKIAVLERGMKLIPTCFKPAGPEEWTGEMQLTVRKLGELAASTEGEFISLGNALQRFSGQSRDISDLSSSLTAMMSGREMCRSDGGSPADHHPGGSAGFRIQAGHRGAQGHSRQNR